MGKSIATTASDSVGENEVGRVEFEYRHVVTGYGGKTDIHRLFRFAGHCLILCNEGS
ncbi:hypothetical protein C439_18958 [Haloferax mediterranei ATCC 33500]|uniref:Uncharacterized protein n=1 Tax=Haloferax mediterranei (strain ATCC 33500 / DSM 1411 / JCM 8866 / NBRC 14739 / NCIMB 2177 / R-4) TaxID=523841 RepID=I3RAH8_HALMT|nr:hypothetical protein HFX_6113 [Haloferax mediterranei ATCC 33500]ELZ97432.1 hypothetical protein C439_18958 [Haloferax mediterranei ATCC 33500]